MSIKLLIASLLLVPVFHTPSVVAAEKGTDVSLHYPLLIEAKQTRAGTKKKTVLIPAEKLNPQLAKLGEKKPFPAYVTIRGELKTTKENRETTTKLVVNQDDIKAYSEWVSYAEGLSDIADKLVPIVEKKTTYTITDPYIASANTPDEDTSTDKKSKVCYNGEPTEVPSLVAGLADSVFSDQLNVFAYRYKSVKEIEDDNLDEKDFPEIWKDWRGQGAAILLLTSYGDGGDDVETNVVTHCASEHQKGAVKPNPAKKRTTKRVTKD